MTGKAELLKAKVEGIRILARADHGDTDLIEDECLEILDILCAIQAGRETF